MKKLGVISLLTVFLLAACGESGGIFEKDLEDRPIDLVALGDSLTVGVGDEEGKQGYAGRFAHSMETEMDGVKSVHLIETAKKGRRSDELIDQLKSGEINDSLKKAEFITLTIGGNDLMKVVRENITNLNKDSFDAERPLYKERYAEIFQLIRKQNKEVPIVAIGVYNPLTVYTDDPSQFEEILKEWNGDMKEIVEKDEHSIFIPVEDLFITNDAQVYSEDYFHPNAKGYVNMNNRIFDTLKKADLEKLSEGKLKIKEQ